MNNATVNVVVHVLYFIFSIPVMKAPGTRQQRYCQACRFSATAARPVSPVGYVMRPVIVIPDD
ncbi:MAG: hypothetical protein JRJ12_12215 [Deltaproteobacteria bacterium]|nr:hypothetical protein [Deltaproteobacteria bacterium]MBW2073108.1 hypothetical protein [Deltaproteobacteria bacterium]